MDSVRRDLSEIESALARVDAGTYGLCVQCGSAIAPERLQLRPAARLCIVCASTHRITASAPHR
jgi:DnaK suppressor protein